MRYVPLVLLAVLAGCATTPADRPVTTETVRVVDGSRSVAIPIVAAPAAAAVRVDAPPARVFSVLRPVYDSLSIPVTRVSAQQRVIGNDGLRLRRRMGSAPLSRYLDCGRTQGGSNADTYEINMTIETVVREGTAGSTLQTSLTATAHSVNFPGAPVRCSSTGELETAIAQGVRARLAG
jgi:hypothetical protein